MGAGDVAWLVEGLLSILEALFSLSSTEYMLQWRMPVISALEWQRQQDQKFMDPVLYGQFGASLCYMRPFLSSPCGHCSASV